MKASLSPDRAARIRHLFDEVVALAADQRAAFLDHACGDDGDLRGEVEALLHADLRADDVLQKLEDPAGPSPEDRAPDTDPLIGQTRSRYRIVEKLGGGGMGVVYKAHDEKLDRLVALKFLPPHLGLDAEAKVRFIHEAKAASALDDANICTVYDIDETDDGRLFIAMAFYAGESLKKKIARGSLPAEEALDYAGQMARGLSKAHTAGIVHRDIKPANVMVTTDGVVKIVDFGLAKVQDVNLTQTGTTLGTVSYMSPEQALGKAVDHRTDLWSSGVVLYEMLTGKRPFGGDYAHSIIYAIRNDGPEPVQVLCPEVPEAVSQVVEKLLKKDPAERYGQAEAVLADLESLRQSVERTRPTSASVSKPSSRRSRLLLYGGVALLVILLLAVGQAVFKSSPASIDSIAVLPMTNHSGDPGQDYFADGMTELLISNLSRLSGLDRVISRTSMMRYKGSDKSMREIGEELGVDVMVEASVLSDSGQVLITVNLIEAETERPLWGDSYERPRHEMSRLPNEMALAIAQQIAIALAPQEEARLTEVTEVDPAVYDLYLKGLQTREMDALARDSLIAYFERAIALDSSFAPAYAALAIEYALESGFGFESRIKADQFAEKALALDPTLSEPYIALGLVREWRDWDWAGAELAFERALALNPGDAFAHHELAQLWMRQGRFEEALAREKQALYLDPVSARYQSGVGEVYLYSRRYDEAITELEKARALNPNVGAYYLGHAYWEKGEYDEALRWWRTNKAVPSNLEVGLARRDAVAGKRAAALAVIEDLKARWTQESKTWEPWSIALIYTDLGDKEEAVDWLEQAYEERLGSLVYVKVEPGFLSLHEEPRFRALLKKMGLD